MISDERLEEISQCSDVLKLFAYEQRQMARELLALRKAFIHPAAYEVKGILCHTLDEAEIYVGEPEPLYRGPE